MSKLHAPSLEDLQKNAQGKIVIVTGAAQGIGYAVAAMFAQQGAQVVVADLLQEPGVKAAESIGRGTYFVKCDVSSWEDNVNLFQSVVAKHGRVDVAVLNAGIDPELSVIQSDKAEAEKRAQQVKFNWLAEERVGDAASGPLKCPATTIFSVNLDGIIFGLKVGQYHMKRAGGGTIAIIGSAAGYLGFPQQDLYCASKHGVLGLFRAAAQRSEFKDHNMKLAHIAPWLVDTPLTARISSDEIAASAEDVAKAVAIVITTPKDEIHGKSICVRGQTYTELESKLVQVHLETMSCA